VNVETKQQPKQWMYTYSPNNLQKAEGSYFLGHEKSADGGIHAARDHKVGSVL
jgi:hypothetical protein